MSDKARLVVITKTDYRFYSEVGDEEEVKSLFNLVKNRLLKMSPKDGGYVEVSDSLIPYNSIDCIFIDRKL